MSVLVENRLAGRTYGLMTTISATTRRRRVAVFALALAGSISNCSSPPPPDPHRQAVLELFGAMDMASVHPVVVARILEEGRRDVPNADPAAVARWEDYARRLAWDSVRSSFVDAFEAVLTLEDVGELNAFFATALGNRVRSLLPDLVWLYVLNEPGAEGLAKLERLFAPFTKGERAEMDALLNGEGLTKMGVAALAGYYRAMVDVAAEPRP